MAVLQQYRNLGVGREMLRAAVKKAIELNYENIFLHAQSHAIDFYQKNGFVAFGEEFLDAGIPHFSMRYREN